MPDAAISPVNSARRGRRGPRRRYHLGPSTFFFISVSLVTAIGAFNSQNNLLFWALGISFASIIVSGLVSGRMLMAVTARRRPVQRSRAGEALALTYVVRNLGRRTPIFALWIDEPSLPRPGQPLHSAAGASTGPAGGDRTPLGSGAKRGRRSPPAVLEREGFLQHVVPQHTRTGRTVLRVLRRGRFTLPSFRVHSSFPFGLMRKSVEFADAATVIVWPERFVLKPSVAREVDRLGQSSRTLWKRPGPGDEFFALREYVEGDPLRSIAWRASARRMAMTGGGAGTRPPGSDLLVRQTSLPTPTRVWIVVRLLVAEPGDPPASLAQANELAISVASSLVNLAIERGLIVGLAVPSAGVLQRPSSGRTHLDRIEDELALIDLDRLSPAPFPHAAGAVDTGCLVLHAGAPDPGYAPGANVQHLAAADCRAEAHVDGRATPAAGKVPSRPDALSGSPSVVPLEAATAPAHQRPRSMTRSGTVARQRAGEAPR